jgi:hypothetical protein
MSFNNAPKFKIDKNALSFFPYITILLHYIACEMFKNAFRYDDFFQKLFNKFSFRVTVEFHRSSDDYVYDQVGTRNDRTKKRF